jgi:hypothetical protein
LVGFFGGFLFGEASKVVLTQILVSKILEVAPHTLRRPDSLGAPAMTPVIFNETQARAGDS